MRSSQAVNLKFRITTGEQKAKVKMAARLKRRTMSTTMVRKKPATGANEGKESRGRRTAPIQVEKELARMVAVIASHRGIGQSDVVSAHLRPFLLAQYELVRQEIQRELDEQKK